MGNPIAASPHLEVQRTSRAKALLAGPPTDRSVAAPTPQIVCYLRAGVRFAMMINSGVDLPMDWKRSCIARLPEYLDDSGDLVPPWERFPGYERYSLGWRMGTGEDWLGLWHVFLEQHDSAFEARLAYLRRHPPAPFTWADAVYDALHPSPIDDENEDERIAKERRGALLEMGLIASNVAYPTWLRQQQGVRWPMDLQRYTGARGAPLHARSRILVAPDRGIARRPSLDGPVGPRCMAVVRNASDNRGDGSPRLRSGPPVARSIAGGGARNAALAVGPHPRRFQTRSRTTWAMSMLSGSGACRRSTIGSTTSATSAPPGCRRAGKDGSPIRCPSIDTIARADICRAAEQKLIGVDACARHALPPRARPIQGRSHGRWATTRVLVAPE